MRLIFSEKMNEWVLNRFVRAVWTINDLPVWAQILVDLNWVIRIVRLSQNIWKVCWEDLWHFLTFLFFTYTKRKRSVQFDSEIYVHVNNFSFWVQSFEFPVSELCIHAQICTGSPIIWLNVSWSDVSQPHASSCHSFSSMFILVEFI